MTKENNSGDNNYAVFTNLETFPVFVTIESKDILYHNFEYVEHMVCGPGVNIDFSNSIYPGCGCVDGCSNNSCTCIIRHEPNYDKKGQLMKVENMSGYCLPVFECNSNCSCLPECINRLTQKGIQFKLEIFQTKDKGLGVRTLQPIPKARYICEYTGELLSYDEAKIRTSKIGKKDKNYLLVLREHVAENRILKTHIDATIQGNVARFMNHSCEPNLDLVPVRINTLVPKLSLFAAERIEEGEELTFSYGYSKQNEKANSDDVKRTNNLMTLRHECLCGASSCSGYLPFEQSLYDS